MFRRILAYVFVISIAACRRQASEHPWYRPSQQWVEAVPLLPQHVYRLPSGRTTAAIHALTHKPWIQLNTEDLLAWSGPQVLAPPNTVAYLVRAVERFPSSHFEVRQQRGVLYVHSHAMGHSTPPTVAQPIIVFLAETPTDLFVSSTVTE